MIQRHIVPKLLRFYVYLFASASVNISPIRKLYLIEYPSYVILMRYSDRGVESHPVIPYKRGLPYSVLQKVYGVYKDIYNQLFGELEDIDVNLLSVYFILKDCIDYKGEFYFSMKQVFGLDLIVRPEYLDKYSFFLSKYDHPHSGLRKIVKRKLLRDRYGVSLSATLHTYIPTPSVFRQWLTLYTTRPRLLLSIVKECIPEIRIT